METESEPELLARYEIGARLARGGFGDLHRAKQRSTGQDVAIKFLRLESEGEDAEQQIQRFRRETRLCAALHHPNIVRERSLDALAARYPRDHPYCHPGPQPAGSRGAARRCVRAGMPACRARPRGAGATALRGRHPDLAETHRLLAALAAERRDSETERIHLDRHRTLRTQPGAGPLVPRWAGSRDREAS